jgi:hypothetical protein
MYSTKEGASECTSWDGVLVWELVADAINTPFPLFLLDQHHDLINGGTPVEFPSCQLTLLFSAQRSTLGSVPCQFP